jgi:hypothetical protein
MRRPLDDQDPNEREFIAGHASAFNAFRDQASQCPHPDLISAALMGLLPGEAAAKVKAHMNVCPLCTMLVEGFSNSSTAGEHDEHEDQLQTTRLLGRIRTEIANETSAQRWFDWPFARLAAVAATVILVVAGLSIVSTRWMSKPSDTQTVQTALPNPGASPQTVFLVPLERAELKLSLDAISWRGTGDSPSKEYFAELGKALEPYNRGDFIEAVTALAGLSGRYPKAVEPYFYRGVSELFTGRPADARASLDRARKVETPALSADIDWYLAVANEREGRRAESAGFIESLCAMESSYQKRACELLPRLKAKTQ